jgi:8-oxo-dGTP pyrophosphatase MutT (NUDIX family)
MITLPIGNSALIVSRDRPGQLIAVHRKENPLLVCFPGGKQEIGESVITGLVREIYEETGLIIPEDKPLPIYSGICEGVKEYWVTAYVIEVDGDVVLNSPEPEMRPMWIHKTDFMKQTSFPIFNTNVFNSVKAFFPY